MKCGRGAQSTQAGNYKVVDTNQNINKMAYKNELIPGEKDNKSRSLKLTQSY